MLTTGYNVAIVKYKKMAIKIDLIQLPFVIFVQNPTLTVLQISIQLLNHMQYFCVPFLNVCVQHKGSA